MKLFGTLMLGAMLAGGAAYAASTPSSAPTATPAPAAQPAVRHASAAHCEKQAKARRLTGDDQRKFVKECRAGKK